MVVLAVFFGVLIALNTRTIQTFLYTLSHDVYAVQDAPGPYSSREIAVRINVSEPPHGETPEAAARACIRAYEIGSYNEGQTATCRVFVNQSSYDQFRAGNSTCELARAVQQPYGTAQDADITVNTSALCVTSKETP